MSVAADRDVVLRPELQVIDAFSGSPTRTVANSEREASAAAVVMGRLEDTTLDLALTTHSGG